MKKSLLKIAVVVALTIACTSCENEGIRPVDPIGKWEKLPDDEVAKVKLWLEKRDSESSIAGETSEIMWGTARYRTVSKDALVISALVADDNDKIFKTAYIFKRDETYNAYVLGHTAVTHGGLDDTFSGELSLYDLDGNVKTTSVVKNGKTVLSKTPQGILRNGISNMRTAVEDDPIILQEVVIEGTRIESNVTWLLLSSANYYDLSFFFPGYEYEGYAGGSHNYAAPLAESDEFDFQAGPVVSMPCVASNFQDGKTATSYTVEIYVDQPKAGTREKWVFNDNGDKLSAGHTFVRLLKQNQDGTKVEHIVGYYPINGDVNPIFGDNTDTGGFRNNDGSSYDVSITYTNLSSMQFYNALNYLNNLQYSTYNLNSKNCSDIGVQCADALGMTLPDTYGTWSGGGGTNPADLGEDIRLMPASTNYTIKKYGGVASTNHSSGC